MSLFAMIRLIIAIRMAEIASTYVRQLLTHGCQINTSIQPGD